MQQYKEYCAKKNVFDCEFKVYYNPDHDGGGPLFVDHIFSKKEFLKNNKNVKSILELCSGPGFIGWYLFHQLEAETVSFSDLNQQVSEGIKLTNKRYNYNFKFHHSDGFDNYDGGKVDLIVCNPPFFDKEEQLQAFVDWYQIEDEKLARYIALDKDFDLHKRIIQQYDKYLNEGGKFILINDKRYNDPKSLVSFAKPDVKYKIDQFNINEKTPNFYTLTFYK
jgi:methylase of polypeptide subunit release factors